MPLLETRGLTRRFPGVLALDTVDFAADRGEVHAVCGANGAGKSTLMNILAGALPPTSGAVLIDGAPATFATPAEARAAGISIVYQEFSSIPELSVADNIFLGREFVRGPWLVDRRAGPQRGRARSSQRYDIRLDPGRASSAASASPTGSWSNSPARCPPRPASSSSTSRPPCCRSPSRRSCSRHAHAQGARHPRPLHLASPRGDIRHRRPGDGAARRQAGGDARHVGAHPARPGAADDRPRGAGDRARAATDLAAAPAVARIAGSESGAFSVHRGEILGLAGLMGAGRTWIARRIAGVVAARRPRRPTSTAGRCPTMPRAALDRGIVYLTEDRKRDGLFMPLAITVNATAASLPSFSPLGLMARRREKKAGGRPAAAPPPRRHLVRGAGRRSQRRQPAEGHLCARTAGEAESCSSATSRRAASMSAPRRRSTRCSASLPPTASQSSSSRRSFPNSSVFATASRLSATAASTALSPIGGSTSTGSPRSSPARRPCRPKPPQ